MDLDARMRIARTYRLLEQPKDAVAHYGACARYLSLGGHPLQAVAVLKELLQVEPTHQESLLFLAKLYARTRAADASNRGRVAVPILDGPPGTAPADAPPLSATGIWRAIRPTETDDLSVVHAADDIGAIVETVPVPALIDDSAEGDVADADVLEQVLPFEEAVLSRVPLFSSLDAAAFVDLSHAMVLGHAEAGDIIFNAGEPGDSCIVIVRGDAIVRRSRAGDGGVKQVEVDRLGPGDVAGLFALVRTEARQATLMADSDVEYFEIDRAAIERLLRTHPAARAALAGVLRDRLVTTLCAEVPLFAGLSSVDRSRLAERFTVALYDDTDDDAVELFDALNERDGLWLVLDGAVVIGDDRADGRVDPRAHLLPGDWVVCAASASSTSAGVTAQAVGRVAVAVLPADALSPLLRGSVATGGAAGDDGAALDLAATLGVTQECTKAVWTGSLRR